jgi:hypothetical protein
MSYCVVTNSSVIKEDFQVHFSNWTEAACPDGQCQHGYLAKEKGYFELPNNY